MKSHQEMIASSQIPENILQHMTTQALVMTCIHYPLFGDLFAYNDFQMGYERMAAHFNGLGELFRRPDAASAALESYKLMSDIGSPNASDSDEKMRFTYLEMLLSQQNIIEQLYKGRKKELEIEALKKYAAKQSSPKFFSNFQLTPSCLILSRVLEVVAPGKIESKKPDLKAKIIYFKQKPFIIDSETMQAIVSASKKIVNNM